MSELTGCADHGCLIKKPEGMGTNGAKCRCPQSQIRQHISELLKTRDDLRATNKRLNRRCQDAESAARVKVEEVQRAGGSIGRALAGWAAGDYRRRLAIGKRLYDALRAKAEWAMRGLNMLAEKEAKRTESTFEGCDYTFAPFVPIPSGFLMRHP